MNKVDDSTTELVWVATPELKPIGKFLGPIMKLGLGRGFGVILEEFKYFVENGKPHPRKVKAMEKAAS